MFKEYESKPIKRLAHLVVESDVIKELKEESTSTLTSIEHGKVIEFKHYEPVKVGDYVVFLNDDDVYHCNAKVFADRNIV